MGFPVIDLTDQQACYQRLRDLLHPGGLTWPRCGVGRSRYTVHRRGNGRAIRPVIDVCIFQQPRMRNANPARGT
jgi:hypothetical protein